MRYGRMAAGVAVVAAVVAGLVWALRPDAVLVDLVEVRVAPMRVVVAAEGVTRVREPWAVTAPITGTVARAPVRVGDRVSGGVTEVAQIQPAVPAFLDARARLQAQAAVTEAQAAVRLAEVMLAQAETDADFAAAQYQRNRELAARGTIPQRALEASQQTAVQSAAALNAAAFELDLHRATLARMEAQLYGPERLPQGAGHGNGNGGCCLPILAPHDGTVLEIADTSARLVQAGTHLMTIGDLEDLKIEVDLLSSDAVRIRPGAAAQVERWGGPGDLAARVERVAPAGFTRVSALGVEEQRVTVELGIESPLELRAGLGDRYRVFVRIELWSDPAALQVPQSALFRQGEDWAVFRLDAGRAVAVPVRIGQAQDETAQVLGGLAAGDRVIAWPGNRNLDGLRVAERPGG